MHFDLHRENILNPIYQKFGVGYNEDNPDPLNHRRYWTQLFANSLTTAQTVSTDQLLTVSPAVDTVSNSKVVTNAIQQMDLTELPPKFLPALVEMTKVGVNLERSARELNRTEPQKDLFVTTLTKIWSKEASE